MISGKRIKRTRFIQTDRFVVAVNVEAVIPDEDPSEPCFEPDTVELLRNVESRRYAKRQLTWFRREPEVRWLNGFGDDPAVLAEAESLIAGNRAR